MKLSGILKLLILFGIKNCDSVKKARKWLDSSGIQYKYHDFRQDGIDRHKLEIWINTLGWESVINRRSTSWKALDSKMKDQIDNKRAIELILKYPTLVKRPVVESKNILLVGFKAAAYAEHFSKSGKEKNHE